MFEISARSSPCGGLVVVLAMEGLLRPTTSAAFGTGALTPIAALAETWRHAQPKLAAHRLWAGLEGKEPSPPNRGVLAGPPSDVSQITRHVADSCHLGGSARCPAPRAP